MQNYPMGVGGTWQGVKVYKKQGNITSVKNYHTHQFYEINLVHSGNIRILLNGQLTDFKGSCIILTAPETPHYIACNSDTLYKRSYLLFEEDFLKGVTPYWEDLKRLFLPDGAVLYITKEQTEFFSKIIDNIEAEENIFRKKLIICYMLSHLYELSDKKSKTPLPQYLIKAMEYINSNYSKKITAKNIAQLLNVSRTTLLCNFTKYLNTTFNEYLSECRLENAKKLILEGLSVEECALKCGFADSGGLIRLFKRKYNITPLEYKKQHS